MKKLIKTIAAVSATAVLAFPANLTANAYIVNSRNFTDGKAMVNKSTDGGRGQRWEYFEYQQDLPRFDQSFLNWKGDYTYLAPVAPKELNSTEYGNCDMLATLDRNVAKSSDIAKARAYVDNIHVKRSNGHQYAVVMEYKNNSHEDSFIGTSKESRIDYMVVDYGLRMLEGPYLSSILNQFYTSDLSELNYNYLKNKGYYTGYLYLDNYYIAGMRLSSSDPYTTFDTPVLEPKKTGFRTKIEFTVRKPQIDKTTLFGLSTVSTSGSNSIDVLKDVKITCNGSGTQSNYIDSYSSTNIGRKTLSIPKSEFYERNNRYQGLLSAYTDPDDLLREVEGREKEYYDDNDFVAAKRNGNNIYIYIGKKYNQYLKGVYLDGNYNNNDWFTTGITKFNAFFKTMGRDKLGHCRWLRTQLESASYVYFYSDATPNSYTSSSFYSCPASDLLYRLNNG